MSRTQQDSDVQEDGEESMEGVVTYDCIIIAEIELDGCSRGVFSRRSVLDFRFPQGKSVGKQEQCKTKDG